MNLVIREGRVIDPSQSVDRQADLWIEGGKIRSVQECTSKDDRTPDLEIDASGLVVAPGLVDIHVHFREPGQTEKEDMESGINAAVAGGFTSVACMPNTTPPNDSVEVAGAIVDRASEVKKCRVYVIGAITKGLLGKELSDMKALKEAGCVAFSDDGRPVNDAHLMREAMKLAKQLDVPIIEHCEELALSSSPTIHAGSVASEMGFEGVTAAAETVDLVRTLVLGGETGCRVHIAHLSAGASVDLIRSFRAAGVKVTCEVTPHHLVLTDEAVRDEGSNAKMYPPLRTDADRATLRAALADGSIDVVATDHAPHTLAEKNGAFPTCPNGIVGLSTALPVLLTLVRDGVISLPDLISRMTTQAADVLGLPAGSLSLGANADVVVFDSDEERTLELGDIRSKSKNTPFSGFKGVGRVRYTVVGGHIEYQSEGA